MTEFNRDEYLTVGRAARFLGVSTETVRRWLESGRLDGVRTAGGHRLISRTSVQANQPRPVTPGEA